MGALLSDQRHQLTDLRVIDRVLKRVGRGRVRLAHVQSQIQHQTLADLTLGLAHTVVGVQREPGDLDRDRLGAALDVVVAVLLQLVLVAILLVLVIIPATRALG